MQTKQSDSQAVLDSVVNHKPLAADVLQRVQQRSQEVQRRIAQNLKADVVVDALRESRDER